MKLDKILRVLVCLALACCIILNVAAMPAHAVGVDWILRQIATDIGVTGILEGLGLFRDTLNGDEYYNNLVSDVKDHLANTGQITGDYIDAYWRIDPLNANPVLTIPLALISVVRNYIFDNGVVYSGPQLPSGVDSSYAEALAHAQSSYSYYCTGYKSDGAFFIGANNDNMYLYSASGNVQVRSGSSISLFSSTSSGEYEWRSIPYINVKGYKDTVIFYETGVTDNQVATSSPITLGVIPPRDTLFNVAYSQWIEHQKEEEDGSTAPMVQIGLGNTVGETESLTQEQIWSGQGTITVPDQGQVSDSVILPGWLQQGIENLRLGLKDILDTLISLPVSIAKAIADIFIPSKDYISAKVEAIRGEFGFIDSVIATGEFIRDSVSGASGPPVIYVDLGRAPSGNYGSQRVLLTDFSWYAPYKGQVDTVLSAALWAFFGWRVFMKLPGIIGGESGYISDVFFPSSSGRSGSDDKKKGGKG